jgi:sugar O-acyltransferase (sialic acid O-acetyltransferase NeuD family)
MKTYSRRKPRPGPRCVILGCGGHGRVVLDILLQAGDVELVGFVDSDPATHGRRVDGLLVLGGQEDLPRLRNELGLESAIVAIGNNGVRRALAMEAEGLGLSLINAIHPSANLARNVTLGRNIVIAAGALVCAHCQIGDSVILNTGCIVDHESLIGTATHVCPGARLAGRVTVGSNAFVGIGATVIQSIRIGHDAVIGAGAVVIDDVSPMSTVVGVPAREIGRIQRAADAPAWMVPEREHYQSASTRPVTNAT